MVNCNQYWIPPLNDQQLKRVNFISNKLNDRHGELDQRIQLVTSLSEADPSHNFKFLTWIVRMFCNNQFLLEDCERLRLDLETLISLKLKGVDVNSFSRLGELYDVLDSNVPHVSNNQAEREIKRDGVTVVHEDAQCTILRLRTEEASVIYGRGTRWCTAATQTKNYFNYYNDQGPLFVIILHGDKEEKYQYHPHSDTLMDYNDLPVSDSHIFKLSKLKGYNILCQCMYAHHHQNLIMRNGTTQEKETCKQLLTLCESWL